MALCLSSLENWGLQKEPLDASGWEFEVGLDTGLSTKEENYSVTAQAPVTIIVGGWVGVREYRNHFLVFMHQLSRLEE